MRKKIKLKSKNETNEQIEINKKRHKNWENR